VSNELAALAAEAYIYGFPLLFDLQAVSGNVDMGLIARAPFNSFSHAAKLAEPDDRFVSINNDTLYSIAQVDVSGGPLLLRVPDTGGRYYVMQFVDAWTNNFAYVGRRADRHRGRVLPADTTRLAGRDAGRGESDRVPDGRGHDRGPLGLRRPR